MLSWLVYAALGKLIIVLWQAFHFPTWLSKFKWLTDLHECDLCSGVWIYVILAFIWKIDIIKIWFGLDNIFSIGLVVTGMLTSWLVHIFSIGFKEKYLDIKIVE